MDKLTVVAWNAINGAPMVFEESALSVIAARDARIKELLEALQAIVSNAADKFHYLDMGIGTRTEAGQRWLAARAALSKED